jgi:small nuclear ribonucleoprotein (snRNP)-like protein
LIAAVILNANRHVTGTLRGFDQFMNVVLDQTVDMKTKTDIGMVVGGDSFHCVGTALSAEVQSTSISDLL